MLKCFFLFVRLIPCIVNLIQLNVGFGGLDSPGLGLGVANPGLAFRLEPHGFGLDLGLSQPFL
jgi:hypothetical protein